MMGKHDFDVNNWKAIDAYEYCLDDGQAAETIPQPIEPIGPSANNKWKCGWDVYYVTKYEFVECPDGSFYVGRSGEGVSLISKTEGLIFAWAEIGFCQDDPFNPGSAHGKGTLNSGTNKDRRLEFKKIKKTYQ